MRVPLFVLSISLGILGNCILGAVFGPGGLAAQEDMRRQIEALDGNINELIAIRNMLTARVESSASDPEVLEIAGHSGGLVAPDELRIRVLGKVPVFEKHEPGTLVIPKVDEGLDPLIIRIVSFMIGATAFFIGSVLVEGEKAVPRARRPYGSTQGIRVQTASLE